MIMLLAHGSRPDTPNPITHGLMHLYLALPLVSLLAIGLLIFALWLVVEPENVRTPQSKKGQK